MSKELNIIEASNMPNTEFEVFYSDGGKGGKIKTTDNGNIVDMFGDFKSTYVDFINAKFIPVQKPVDFMDLVKNSEGKKVYVEMDIDGYCDIKLPKESDYFEYYLYYIMRNNYSENVREVILDGKWYIEE